MNAYTNATLLLLAVLTFLLVLDWRQTLTIVKENRAETNPVLSWLWSKFDSKEKVVNGFFIAALSVWPFAFVIFFPAQYYLLTIGLAMCLPNQIGRVYNNFKAGIKPSGF